MVSSYFKHCIRKIKETFPRYFSILIIVMLGVTFFIGMNSISPVMKDTAISYLNDKKAYDIQVFSSLGLTGDDINSLKTIDGVLEVCPAYTVDVLIKENNRDVPIRTNSLNLNSNMNKTELLFGRLPENKDECVIDERMVEDMHFNLGDIIEIYSGSKDNDISDSFGVTKFKIVGAIISPIYVSKYYGATNVGSGELEGNIYLLEDAYNMEVFTNAYISTNVESTSKFDETFQKKIDKINRNIEKIAPLRATIRYKEVFSEINKEINDGKIEISDGEAKITNTQKELDQARNEINNALNDLLISVGEVSFVQNRKELESISKDLEQKERNYTEKQNELSSLDNKINSLINEMYKSEEVTINRAEVNNELSTLNIKYESLKSETDKLAKEIISKNEEFKNKEQIINNYANTANNKLAATYAGTRDYRTTKF